METTDLVIVSSVVAAGTTLIRNVKEGKTKAAPIIFGFMMAAGLLLIAIPLPKVARGLSYFALVGAFAVNGPTIFGLASGLTSSGAPKQAPARGTSTGQGGGRFPIP